VFLASLRVIGFVIFFGENSLQMDFSAFYTAGEAVNAGLSPYRNHYSQTPPIWDGVARYSHSRFLYLPLAAVLFAPMALLPYHTAKYLWMTMNVFSVLTSLSLSVRASETDLKGGGVWLAILFLLTFHPLLPLLERGQIDGLALLLVTAAFALMSAGRRDLIAGILLSCATLCKLHVGLVLPFVLLRKRFRVLFGYAVGLFLIVTASCVFCGPSALLRYGREELPRISKFGELGPKEMLADSTAIASLIPSPGFTTKDACTYHLSRLSFEANASLVRTGVGWRVSRLLAAAHLPNTPSHVSVLLFSGSFVMLFVSLGNLLWRSLPPAQEYLFWQLIATIVLLTAPLTWVMNAIWLVALLPFAIGSISSKQTNGRNLGIALVVFGLVIAWLPDQMSFPSLIPGRRLDRLASLKYVFAELAVVVGLVVQLRQYRLRRTRDPEQPVH